MNMYIIYIYHYCIFSCLLTNHFKFQSKYIEIPEPCAIHFKKKFTEGKQLAMLTLTNRSMEALINIKKTSLVK